MDLIHAKTALHLAIQQDIPALMWGDPGIGKSSIVHELAQDEGIPLLDWRLTEYESVDMRGTPRERNGRTFWAPPEELPIINGNGKKVSCIINGEKVEAERGIILLDELAQAKPDVKNLAARLVLERRIGEARLGKGWRILAASNRLGTATGTSPMPKHLDNRFWHIEVEASIQAWIAWAEAHGVDDRIIAYLKYRPQALMTFDPRSKDAAFASPRSWVDGVNRLLKGLNGQEATMDAALLGEFMSGNVGREHGMEFAAFLRTLLALVSIEQILLDPQGAPLPREPSICYAIATALAAHIKKETIEAAFVYTQRMSKEFAFVFAHKVKLMQPTMQRTKAFTTFAALNADFV